MRNFHIIGSAAMAVADAQLASLAGACKRL
jgi:hypothetical protein